MDAGYYSPVDMEENSNYKHFVLALEKYLEVTEVYVLTVLGRNSGNVNLAFSWVEKAALPEGKRQVSESYQHPLLNIFLCVIHFQVIANCVLSPWEKNYL